METPTPNRTSWLRPACAGVIGLYALCFGFLVFAINREDHQINVVLVVLCLAGLAAAALVLAVRASWTAWTALAYSIVSAAADAPYQVAGVMQPSGHAAASAFILLVTAAAIVVSALTVMKTRGTAGDRVPSASRAK